MLRQQVFSEVATEGHNGPSAVGEYRAPINDFYRARLLLFSQSHINQAVFVHEFLCEHVFEPVDKDRATPLVKLFQYVKRERAINHGWYGDRERVSTQQPDCYQLSFFKRAKL